MRVLIVEDENAPAMTLYAMVSRAGHEVVGPVGRVTAALDVVARKTLDAALLDVNLHGEVVFPVADALAARGVPFIFVTGDDTGVLQTRYTGRPVIQKPFQRDEILSALAYMAAAHGGAGAQLPTESLPQPTLFPNFSR